MLFEAQSFVTNCCKGDATCLLDLGVPARKVTDPFLSIRNT